VLRRSSVMPWKRVTRFDGAERPPSRRRCAPATKRRTLLRTLDVDDGITIPCKPRHSWPRVRRDVEQADPRARSSPVPDVAVIESLLIANRVKSPGASPDAGA